MLKSISIDYSSEISIFLESFDLEAANQEDFEVLIAENIPTLSNGVKLLSELSFNLQIINKPNVFGIILKVNEEISETQDEQQLISDFKIKDKLLISFQSTIGKHESKTYWKVPGYEKLKSIYIDDDENKCIASIIHEFLVDEIKAKRTGK